MRNKTLIAGIALTAVVALGCGAGSDEDEGTTGPGAQPQPGASTTQADDKGRKIELEISGPAKASNVTYLLDGDTSQDNGVKLPWKKTLTSTDSVTIVTISAQNAGTSGTITCKITVDGKVIKTNSSKGEYAVVNCTSDAIS